MERMGIGYISGPKRLRLCMKGSPRQSSLLAGYAMSRTAPQQEDQESKAVATLYSILWCLSRDNKQHSLRVNCFERPTCEEMLSSDTNY